MTADQVLILVASGAFGAVIGSFLNVVIYRLPLPDRSILHPRRSHCPSCDHEIAWFDNLPVVSWLLLRGKCRSCKAGISLRYPLVELLTSCLFVLLAMRYVVGPGRGANVGAWLHLAAADVFVCVLVVATFIDLAHTIIPDRITLRGMVLAPLVSLIAPGLHQTQWIPGASPRAAALVLSLAGLVAGAGAIWLIGFVGGIVFRKKAAEHGGAMGLGDVKFMGLVGGILGPVGVLLAILIGCFAGALFGIPRLLFSKQHWMPFGPFLSIGALAVLVWRAEIVHFIEHDYVRLVSRLLP